MIGTYLMSLLTAALGTFGILMMWHAPRRSWLPASALAGIGWVIYVAALASGLDEAPSIFLGCFIACLLAQLTAKKLKMISTIFTSAAIIPSVPGLSMYRFMSLMAQGKNDEGIAYGVTAMTDVLMIALAVALSAYLMHLLRHRK